MHRYALQAPTSHRLLYRHGSCILFWLIFPSQLTSPSHAMLPFRSLHTCTPSSPLLPRHPRSIQESRTPPYILMQKPPSIPAQYLSLLHIRFTSPPLGPHPHRRHTRTSTGVTPLTSPLVRFLPVYPPFCASALPASLIYQGRQVEQPVAAKQCGQQ